MLSQSPRFTKHFMLLSDSSQSHAKSGLLLKIVLLLLLQLLFQVTSPLLDEGKILLLEPYALQRRKAEMGQGFDQACEFGVQDSILWRKNQRWERFAEQLKVRATGIFHLRCHAIQSES